ncbi:hypothetical protein [Anaerosporobacter sp.]|uniref:hypothetical protein n=1 Tax=Anaerosporobacter sp. TaxID=1872529 RepID=UPI00286F9B14|nr:hypothetical protein [Anaerosporobacter sp.]
MEIKRSLIRYGFWCAILLVPVICILSNMDVLTNVIQEGDNPNFYSVIYIFNSTTTDGWFLELIFIIAMLPAGLFYYHDKKENASTYTLIRTNATTYGRTLFFSIITITWVCIFVGLMLLLFILCMFFPVSTAVDMMWEPYHVVILAGHPFLFFIIKSSILSSLCTVFVSCGLIISTLIADRFVILVSPFLIYYFTDKISYAINPRFCVYCFTKANLNLGSVTTSFIGTHLILLIIVLLLGSIFVSQVERNVKHADT